MTLPASGAISLGQVNTELGVSATATRSLNDSTTRTLFGVASGAISMSNGYGKSNVFAFTISANQVNANLRSLAVAAGWGGSSAVTATVNSGVYIYSTSTGTPGLTIDGSWPGGVTLVNNGYIMGMGGAGADAANYAYVRAGNAGGNAISLGVSCSITNNSYIGGGGGGGAGCMASGNLGAPGGGGAGGGVGGTATMAGYGTTTGGAGGGPGSSGSTGQISGPYAGSKGSEYYVGAGGGGGGRIMPGSGGASGYYGGLPAPSGGGAGGGGYSSMTTSNGGSGGGAGGTTSGYGQLGSGGGGGWGASGGGSIFSTYGTASGGAGGKCVALNGFTVTWNTVGTRYGAIS